MKQKIKNVAVATFFYFHLSSRISANAIPNSKQYATKELPPCDMNGNVIPLAGIIRSVDAKLMQT